MGEMLKRLKHNTGMWFLVIGAGIGIILLILGINEEKTDVSSVSKEVSAEPEADYLYERYADQIEQKIRSLIESMDGISDAKVMVTLESGTETVYAQNDISSSGGGVTREYVIVDGGGSEKALTLKEVYPRLRGVAVVCTGGNDPVLVSKIISLISTLFGISSNHVSVSG